jgi:hypothetical protein
VNLLMMFFVDQALIFLARRPKYIATQDITTSNEAQDYHMLGFVFMLAGFASLILCSGDPQPHRAGNSSSVQA